MIVLKNVLETFPRFLLEKQKCLLEKVKLFKIMNYILKYQIRANFQKKLRRYVSEKPVLQSRDNRVDKK